MAGVVITPESSVMEVRLYLQMRGVKSMDIKNGVACGYTDCLAERGKYCNGPLLHATRRRAFLKQLLAAECGSDAEGDVW